MADWKRVLTAEGDIATHQNDKITLAQLFAGLDASSTAGGNQILKTNANHDALVWADDEGGIALTDLSVGSEGTPSGNGGISYNNAGVFSYTAPANLPDQSVSTDASPSWVDGTFTGGDLYVKGGEGGAATLYLYSDEGDDSQDKWTITTGTTGGSLSFKQDGTTELAISSAGQVSTTGNLIVGGNIIKGAGGGNCMTLDGTAGSVTFSGPVIAQSYNISGGSATLQGGDLIVKTSANNEVFKIDNSNGTGVDVGTMTGNFVVTGNLTVNGGTTTISTTNLEVEDKNIVLGTPNSAFANDAAAITANTGGGISIVTDSETAGNYANLTWNSGKNLTGWCLEDTANAGVFEAAVMEYSDNSTAPSGDAAGVGSFHYDTGDDKLYIRTA